MANRQHTQLHETKWHLELLAVFCYIIPCITFKAVGLSCMCEFPNHCTSVGTQCCASEVSHLQSMLAFQIAFKVQLLLGRSSISGLQIASPYIGYSSSLRHTHTHCHKLNYYFGHSFYFHQNSAVTRQVSYSYLYLTCI